MYIKNIVLLFVTRVCVGGVFEYGKHQHGEEMAIRSQGEIPSYLGVWSLSLKHPFNDSLQPSFTYIRVDYLNVVSKVRITYNEKTQILKFSIKLPFAPTSYEVQAFALPRTKKDSSNENMPTMFRGLFSDSNNTIGDNNLLVNYLRSDMVQSDRSDLIHVLEKFLFGLKNKPYEE